MNIIEPFRAEIRRYVDERPKLKLHKFFHHLNSSQALALNLFFPFFEFGGSEVLLQALGNPAVMAGWEPEYVADPIEGTNVDITWVAPDGARTYCEVKLSEQEFGAAIDDSRHRRKLEDIYAPDLRGRCTDSLLVPTVFFSNYQIMRNIWLAARDSRASTLFLLPRANRGLWAPLNAVLTHLSPELAARVHATALEDVLSSLSHAEGLSPMLAIHARALREKYVATD